MDKPDAAKIRLNAVLRAEAASPTTILAPVDPSIDRRTHDAAIARAAVDESGATRVPHAVAVVGQNLETVRAIDQGLTSAVARNEFSAQLNNVVADWFLRPALPLVFEIALDHGIPLPEAVDFVLGDPAVDRQLVPAANWVRGRIVLSGASFSTDDIAQCCDIVEAAKRKLYARAARFLAKPALYPDDAAQAKEVFGALERLGRAVATVAAHRLHAELAETANAEVNRDRQSLVSRFDHFGFSPDLRAALDAADRDLFGGSDEFQWKSCMGHLRSFFHSLLLHLIARLQQASGLEFHGADDKFEPMLKYLKASGVDFLHGIDATWLDVVQTWTSAVGVHPLRAKREDARIARNIVIEVSLYMVHRLEEHEAKRVPGAPHAPTVEQAKPMRGPETAAGQG